MYFIRYVQKTFMSFVMYRKHLFYPLFPENINSFSHVLNIFILFFKLFNSFNLSFMYRKHLIYPSCTEHLSFLFCTENINYIRHVQIAFIVSFMYRILFMYPLCTECIYFIRYV